MIWRATVLTLFPEMFPGPLGGSLAGRGLGEGIWSLEARNIRDFQHTEMVVAPSIKTEGKTEQRAQKVGMGAQ